MTTARTAKISRKSISPRTLSEIFNRRISKSGCASIGKSSAELKPHYHSLWIWLLGSVVAGPNPLDPIRIEDNILSHPEGLKAAIASVELCREVGNSAPLRPFAKREVMPDNLKRPGLESFVRNALMSYAHQTCTAKMGSIPCRLSMAISGCMESIPPCC